MNPHTSSSIENPQALQLGGGAEYIAESLHVETKSNTHIILEKKVFHDT